MNVQEQIEFLKISGSVLPMGAAEEIIASMEALLEENKRLNAQDEIHWKTRRTLLKRQELLEKVVEAAHEAAPQDLYGYDMDALDKLRKALAALNG